MYPPRKPEEYRPPSEFKTAVFFACMWFGVATLAGLASGDPLKNAWLFVIAGIETLDAILIKAQAKKTVRIAAKVTCVVAVALFGLLLWLAHRDAR